MLWLIGVQRSNTWGGERVKCANANVRGTIWFERSMCMFEHVFSKFYDTGLVYMASRIYGIKTRCKWFDFNDTNPNDAQPSNLNEINLV